MIAKDLSNQQAFDVVYFIWCWYRKKNLKTIKQIDFTGNLDYYAETILFFIIKKAKETILHFSQRTVRIL